MTRVYVDMVADLFHIGHLNLIKEAKKLGDKLIVGVHSDEDVMTYKRKPVIPFNQRSEIIKNIKQVDEVIEKAPLILTEDFLDKNNIDIVVHGDDVSDSLKEQHKVAIEKNIVKYIPYTKSTSTTKIIKQIKERKDL